MIYNVYVNDEFRGELKAASHDKAYKLACELHPDCNPAMIRVILLAN